jgi:hypothetical protein
VRRNHGRLLDHSNAAARHFGLAERKLGLRYLGWQFAVSRSISLEPLTKFAAPGAIVFFADCAGCRRDTLRLLGGRGTLFGSERGTAVFVGRQLYAEIGITEIAGSYARRQYAATLRACLCHRWFLRCGRVHSGEEGTP